MFNKIVTYGNADVVVRNTTPSVAKTVVLHVTQNPPDPSVRPATRFLSRFDKSATNIKESQIFVEIGQVLFIYFPLPPTSHIIY